MIWTDTFENLSWLTQHHSVPRGTHSLGPQKGTAALTTTTTEAATTEEPTTEAAAVVTETNTEASSTPEVAPQKDEEDQQIIHDHTVVAESTTIATSPMTEPSQPERKRRCYSKKEMRQFRLYHQVPSPTIEPTTSRVSRALRTRLARRFH